MRLGKAMEVGLSPRAHATLVRELTGGPGCWLCLAVAIFGGMNPQLEVHSPVTLTLYLSIF